MSLKNPGIYLSPRLVDYKGTDHVLCRLSLSTVGFCSSLCSPRQDFLCEQALSSHPTSLATSEKSASFTAVVSSSELFLSEMPETQSPSLN